jgi:hypothetical protein
MRYEHGERSFPTVIFPGHEDGNGRSPIPLPPTCHCTVRRGGATIDTFVHWVRIGSLTAPHPLLAAGKVGVGVVWDFTAAFDNFRVRT